MDFSTCRLYNVTSFKSLESILGDGIYCYKKRSCNNYNIYINTKGRKPRLIESPRCQLRKLQSLILKELAALQLPLYYTAQKGMNNITNAERHRWNSVVYQTDIHKFFPSTSRTKVFNFWRNTMKMSVGMAMVMTNITVVNYQNERVREDVKTFCMENDLGLLQHLPTGAPTSQLLAFLVNFDLFEALYSLSTELGFIMTVYVDDITFSGKCDFYLQKLKKQVKKLINEKGYNVSSKKTFSAKFKSTFSITGIAINYSRLSPSSDTFKKWRKTGRNAGRSRYCNMIYSRNN